jgi:tetratricopeptide (TPR) repeat protein
LKAAALVGICFAASGPAAAQEAPAGDAAPECADEACFAGEGAALLEAGRFEDAVGLLEAAAEALPESGAIQVLLGVAYLRAGRQLWAIDAFARRLEQDPADCEARAWLAWTWLGQAALDEARALLDEGDCAAAPGPGGTRVLMLRILAEHYAGETEAARAVLGRIRARDEAYAADREALAGLVRTVVPDRFEDLSWRLDVGGGYATNALLGSPVDPEGAGVDADSGLLTVDAWLRFAPDLGFWLRPTVELQPRMQYFFGPGGLEPPGDEVESQSFFTLSGRAGAYIDWGVPRLLLAWRPEYLLLRGGNEGFDYEAPVWYAAAHRGEIEFEITSWLLMFAGAGHRTFWELGRNRVEFDGGFGGRVALIDGLALLWSASGRGYWAASDAYDLGGGSIVLNLQYRLPGGWSTRAGLTLAGDWYPVSAGFYGPEEEPYAQSRRDRFLKAGGAVWSPAVVWGLRFGATYDYSVRDSTIPEYGFSDHRVLFKVSWAASADVLGLPSVSPDAPVADIDWGLGEGAGAMDERIQDLLRQEEQVYRSCGCAE